MISRVLLVALVLYLGRMVSTLPRSIFGREKPGGNAIALIAVDNEIGADILDEVMALEQVTLAKALLF